MRGSARPWQCTTLAVHDRSGTWTWQCTTLAVHDPGSARPWQCTIVVVHGHRSARPWLCITMEQSEPISTCMKLNINIYNSARTQPCITIAFTDVFS